MASSGGEVPDSKTAAPPDYTSRGLSPESAARSFWAEVGGNASAFALIFTALFLTHLPLLRLPYFWDEAGYFIPAARDLLLTGSLIPHYHALQRASAAAHAVAGVLVEVQRLHAGGHAISPCC